MWVPDRFVEGAVGPDLTLLADNERVIANVPRGWIIERWEDDRDDS